jgi:5-methylthioribose kinase
LEHEAAVLEAPVLFLLDISNVAALTAYLSVRRVLAPGEEIVALTTAGEGNMNCTLRVATPRRTFIVKQGRPFVEKYPQIAAPADRTRVEASFYRAAARCPAASARMPALLDADDDARIVVLEDLGAARDFTNLYAGAVLSRTECGTLADYLLTIHRCGMPRAERDVFANREMRALNHEHIFALPLREENGLALDAITPGLQAVADVLKRDRAYVERVRALGERYLADGDALVHGDFFPGSWLRVLDDGGSVAEGNGVAVIDPEFCFLGGGEFDFGVMLGHLALASQPSDVIGQVECAVPRGYDVHAVRQFAGVEIMRRLVGVAQLPLAASLAVKRRLLDESRRLVLA